MKLIKNHEDPRGLKGQGVMKGTPINTAEQQLGYQGTQSSVESITILIQDTPAVYFTFKYTRIFIYMIEGQKQRLVCSFHHHQINI